MAACLSATPTFATTNETATTPPLHTHPSPHTHNPHTHMHRHTHPPTTSTSTTTYTLDCTTDPSTTTYTASTHAHTPHLLSTPPQPLTISINLRLSGSSRVLLREDIFIPTTGSETLAHLFRAALLRHPAHVGRYMLRRDKAVVVLCADHACSTYAKPSAVFATLARAHPTRLIFCVHPNAEVIRVLDARKNYSLTVNARAPNDPACLLKHDLVVDAPGNASVNSLWMRLSAEVPHLRQMNLVSLHTLRPGDGFALRFGLQDLVSDIVKSGGRRFIFIVGPPELPPLVDHRHGHQHHEVQKKPMAVRFRCMFRFRQDPCEHGKRKIQWGLVQKK